jgi:hypothetical protein
MYWHGCNYPWSTDGRTIYYGLDFGANVWGSHLGVSTRRPAIARDFAEMALLGFTIARWFVFADGRAGIAYGTAGMPDAPDPLLFSDMDAALEIARDVGMRIDFVLLDHRWMFDGVRETIADEATGDLLEGTLPCGRAEILLSPEGRDALVYDVFLPIVQRYGPMGERRDLAPQVFAFELMNEPDFVIDEWEHDLSRRVSRPLPFEVVAELVASLSDVVHGHSSALATLGCARLHNLWAWDDDALGLDVLQVPSYPDVRYPERDADLFGVPASGLGVRRGVILGEFPGNAAERHPAAAAPPVTTLDDYLEFAVSSGYMGAWPWSFSGTDAYGPLPREPLRRFAARYPQLVNPRSAELLQG